MSGISSEISFGFGADNANTGAELMAGKINYFCRLKKGGPKSICSDECNPHYPETTVDRLLLDTELSVIKTYKYFHIYTIKTM